MHEFDTYEHIRKTLTDATSEAPDFDALFGKELLGNDPLRSVVHEKLAEAEVEAPSFEELFRGQLLGKKPQGRSVRLLPWWSVATVAAACLTVFFLLPDRLSQNPESSSQARAPKTAPAVVKNILPTLRTQLVKVPTNRPVIDTLNTLSDTPAPTQVRSTENAIDTTVQESWSKIKPNRSTALPVQTSRTVAEAYASASARKRHRRTDKITLGLGLNSANRLLSMVNTKTDAGFALQSVASSASNGYASLEGASPSMLRTTTTAPNEWMAPDNITANMLQNCETNYSLPINFGLSVSIPIVQDVNLITGIQYAYLANHITGSTFDLKQELHYLGIPLKLAVNLVKRGDFAVYSALGGTIEKGLAGVQTSTVEGDGVWKGTQSIDGLQTSLTGQFGLSYSLNTKFLLYVEPGVAWYIPSDQPISNRTEEPFHFNLSMGLRYKLP